MHNIILRTKIKNKYTALRKLRTVDLLQYFEKKCSDNVERDHHILKACNV